MRTEFWAVAAEQAAGVGVFFAAYFVSGFLPMGANIALSVIVGIGAFVGFDRGGDARAVRSLFLPLECGKCFLFPRSGVCVFISVFSSHGGMPVSLAGRGHPSQDEPRVLCGVFYHSVHRASHRLGRRRRRRDRRLDRFWRRGRQGQEKAKGKISKADG